MNTNTSSKCQLFAAAHVQVCWCIYFQLFNYFRIASWIYRMGINLSLYNKKSQRIHGILLYASMGSCTVYANWSQPSPH